MKLFNTYTTEFKGETFESFGVIYRFEKQIKGDKFKYVPVGMTEAGKAKREAAAAEEKLWGNYLDELYSRLTCKDVAKAINKAYKGRLTGKSRTTESTYGELRSGITYRVAKHDAYTRASLRNDVLVTFEEGVIQVGDQEVCVELNESAESVTARVVAAFGKELN